MAPPSISQQTNFQRFFSKLSAARAGLRAYDNWAVFVLAWAVVFGGIVRLLPVWGGIAPVNDGGLFYSMTQELQAAHFGLPWYSAYNAAQIPYAYPPLSFYVMGLANAASHIPLLALYQWLPPLLSILTIPAFYLLAKLLLRSGMEASLATVAFAMLPRSYKWMVMGGGAPRALGMLFSLLALYSLAKMLSSDQKRWIALTTLLAALVCLTHPEWALHTAFIMGLFWLFLGRNRKNALKMAIVALGVVMLTAPWWGTVVYRHGLEPYLSALHTGGRNSLFWVPLLIFNFAEEPYIGLLSVLTLLGLLVSLYKKNWLLPVWLILPFFVELRNAATVVTAPMAMLASIGVCEALIPGFRWLERQAKNSSEELKPFSSQKEWNDAFNRSGILKGLLAFLLVYSLISAIRISYELTYLRLTAEDRTALQWVADNTPKGSRFMVVGKGGYFEMPLQEWFPALTGRANLGVVQGYEWIAGEDFPYRVAYYIEAAKCAWSTVQCLDQWVADNHTSYDYVWVHQREYKAPEYAQQGIGALLETSLQNSEGFSLVFESPNIKVYKHLETTR